MQTSWQTYVLHESRQYCAYGVTCQLLANFLRRDTSRAQVKRDLQIVSVTPLNLPILPLQSNLLYLYGCTFSCFVGDLPQMFAVITANYVHKLPASSSALNMGWHKYKPCGQLMSVITLFHPAVLLCVVFTQCFNYVVSTSKVGRVNVELPLCLITDHVINTKGNRNMVQRILKHGTRKGRSASRSGHFSLRYRAPTAHYKSGWVDPIANLYAVEQKTISCLCW